MQHQIGKRGLFQITPESFTISSSFYQVEPVPSVVLDRANHKAESRSRNPNCALCQNHGKAVRTKAHKRYCPWKDCECSKCNLTKNRRKAVALQIAARRALKQDQEREKEMMETESRDCDVDKDVKVFPKQHTFSLNKTLEKYYIKLSTSRESSHSTSSPGSHTESVTSSSSSFDSTLNVGDFSRKKSTATSTQLQESIQTLNKMFCLSHENEYHIYRIWREFGGDYRLAAAKIFESMYGHRSHTQIEDSLRMYAALEQFVSHQLLQ